MESSNNNYIKEFKSILALNNSKRKELAQSEKRVENEFHIEKRQNKFLDLIK